MAVISLYGRLPFERKYVAYCMMILTEIFLRLIFVFVVKDM
jgi:hypothetical protein